MSTSTSTPESILLEQHRKADGKFGERDLTPADIVLDYEAPVIRPLQSQYINDGGVTTHEAAWEFVNMFPNATAEDFENAVDDFDSEEDLRHELNNPNSPFVVDPDGHTIWVLPSGGRAVVNNAAVRKFLTA